MFATTALLPGGQPSGSPAGQDLLLSRTVIDDEKSPYVDRFACGWHRLAGASLPAEETFRRNHGPERVP
jgi:hypothetical protein